MFETFNARLSSFERIKILEYLCNFMRYVIISIVFQIV